MFNIFMQTNGSDGKPIGDKKIIGNGPYETSDLAAMEMRESIDGMDCDGTKTHREDIGLSVIVWSDGMYTNYWIGENYE